MGNTTVSNHTMTLEAAVYEAASVAMEAGTIMVVVRDPTDEFAEEGQDFGFCPAAAYEILYGTLDRAGMAWVKAIINPNGEEVWRSKR
jgi:hypothetical protein